MTAKRLSFVGVKSGIKKFIDAFLAHDLLTLSAALAFYTALALTAGAVTAVLFMIGKSVIGMYQGHSAVGSAYKAAGSFIVLLAWVYYSSIILFSGAEITRLVGAQNGNEEANEAKPNRTTFTNATIT